MELREDQLDFLRGLARDRAGIRLEGRGVPFFAHRLEALLEDFSVASVEDLLRALRSGRDERLCAAAIEAMTTNETSFFRDGHPFEALQRDVLPALAAARDGLRRLTVWSMACSTGQEVWSLAIALRERLPAASGWRLRIVGSDLCTSVLERALAGVYSTAELRRGLDDARRARWFEPVDDGWRVTEELRSCCEFQKVNLHGDWPDLGRVDLALLRNVMIYFSDEDKRRILQRLHERLADDGVLCLGGSETLLGLGSGFRRLAHGRAAFYRRDDEHPGHA